ncbi:MAG TPA: pantetheine-phosphate adenylyltransferase [bacterium]|nr:pantetheine-phosphate adenylyltransferase [bacterium]
MRKVIYPGSFDPVTFGHIDVAKRAVSIFGNLTLAIVLNPEKRGLFTLQERVDMLKQATKGIKGISIDTFDGLLVNFVRQNKANVIVRGLRAISDFEYEFQMALTNRKLDERIETVFLMSSEQYSYLSSRAIKEIATLGGDVARFVPPCVAALLRRKLSAANRS